MARMIPSEIYNQTAPPGEVDLFKYLHDDPDTNDWVVLHSLDIVNHRTQTCGEVDFVVIIPHKGVLFFEVKSHNYINYKDGTWYYGTNDHKGETRGPFKQAANAMQSVRKRVNEKMPALKSTPFGHGVVFTNCEFNKSSEEWHDWQIIDSRKFGKEPISKLFGQMIDKWRDHYTSGPNGGWFNPSDNEPGLEKVEVLKNYLRPNFEIYESPKSQAARRAEELKRYTAEQFKAIDRMDENARLITVGPAGTGKTLLAIEAARRAAAQNKSVLFLCFNKYLGRWLEKETEPLVPLVTTSTLHKHLRKVAKQEDVEPPEDSKYWSEDLPLIASEQLLTDDSEKFVFDELIIDEAQDIFQKNYFDFLDLSLRGGIAGGNWRFFGDFERQSIYNHGEPIPLEALSPRFGYAPICRLRDNCRNKPRIAEMVHLLGGLNPGYSQILRPDDNQDPKFYYYKNDEAQLELLISSLAELYRDGFSASDIVVLSPRKSSDSIAAKVKISPWKERLRPFSVAGDKQIGYSSIHAFKGLEAGAIVVTDIESISDASDLFYIAVTRALHRLYLLISDDAKADVLQTLMQLAAQNNQ